MNERRRFRDFTLGAIASVLIFQLAVPSMAAMMKNTIDAYTGVNIYVDDARLPDMEKQEGVTEELKAANQMEWVGRMNSIHNRAEEIVLTELVYN